VMRSLVVLDSIWETVSAMVGNGGWAIVVVV
jgi:hypothetical protein